MALTGRLSELSPAEIFQLISLSKKDGKLVLTQGDRQAVVVFRGGRVVFAASDTLHSSFCRTLAQGRVVADGTFIEEVERHYPGSTTDSGSFTVQYREAHEGALEEIVREHIERTARELLGWRSGHFVFESVQLPRGEDIVLDSGWFLLDSGINPDELLLAALTKLDDDEREQWERDLEEAAAREHRVETQLNPQSDISAAFQVLVDQSTGKVSWAPMPIFGSDPDRDLSNLRQLMGEANGLKGVSPGLTAEVALLILRYAAQVVNRGVLFAVREDRLQGIGQFGLQIEDESPDERVRHLWLPCDGSSVLAAVVASGETFIGRATPSRWNTFLLDRLGGGEPRDVVVVPLVVEGRVAGVLYGDNLPHTTGIGTVDGLEIMMHEIGLGVERARLERQLEEMGKR